MTGQGGLRQALLPACAIFATLSSPSCCPPWVPVWQQCSSSHSLPSAPPHRCTADWDRFASRMRQYGSIWCCIHAHPGHIHYDLLWDVPHFDKFNRVWNGTWEVKTGP